MKGSLNAPLLIVGELTAQFDAAMSRLHVAESERDALLETVVVDSPDFAEEFAEYRASVERHQMAEGLGNRSRESCTARGPT